MLNWLKIAITSTPLVTVVSGVIVYVLTEDFKEYVIEPRRSYKQIQGRIAYLLTYYHFCLINPLDPDRDNGKIEDTYIQASQEFMKCAAEVIQFSQIRPKFLPGVPSVFILQEAQYRLIGLASGCFKNKSGDTVSDNQKELKFLRQMLNIKRTDSQIQNDLY